MEDYSFEQKLGAGAQGEVYQVRHNQTKKAYAMKVICCSDHEQVNAALKEIKVLLQLRHAHIVSYVDFFLVFNSAKTRHEFEFFSGSRTAFTEKDSLLLSVQKEAGQSKAVPQGKGKGSPPMLTDEEIAVCLVMELCDKGDMQGLIRDSKQKMMESGKHPINEAQVLSWMEQSVRALDFIHNKGFLHRDLKPTNIFFDSLRDAKVGDFGLAATVGLGRHSAVGTPFYLAPERMLEERYDGKVDVWGLGVVMLELMTLKERPINSLVLSDPNVPDKMVPEMTKMGFSAKLAALIRDMIQRFPEGRPSTAAILQRISTMTVSSPPLGLGLSSSLFAGMSCPKLDDVLCDNCEVEPAQVVCPVCRTTLCDACDRAKHKHHSRQSHERTSISNITSSSVLQQTLSSSRTSPAFSEQRNVSLFPSPTNSSQGSRQASHDTGKGYNRLQMAAFPHGNSLSMSDFSISVRRGESSSLFASDPVVRIPQDYPDLSTALRMLANLPHVRKVVLGANTVQSAPIVLTDALPDNLKIVGENPSPVIEVADTAFAVQFASGRGVLENIIIRHVGRCRVGLANAEQVNRQAGASSANGGGASVKDKDKDRKAPRPSAVSITGGEWRLHRCRISCVDGCGVTVGGSRRTDASPRSPSVGRTQGIRAVVKELDEGELKPLEPVITKCTFIDITTAGVVVNEKARGLYEGNSFSGCGYAAFLLKKECEPTIRANHITDGAETGIFCQDGCGTIEHNLIAQNAGCGVVIKGPLASPVFRKNRVLNNSQAGFFCCDHCSPFISDNEVKQNQKAGVLIKTGASPKVTKNVIEGGKEAGVYVFEGGAGIIEENTVRGNMNAGLLVTTRGKPHVIHNTLTANAYEGIWVCKDGGGTFCDNDLRGNVKGPMDLDKACRVTWIGNVEH